MHVLYQRQGLHCSRLEKAGSTPCPAVWLWALSDHPSLPASFPLFLLFLFRYQHLFSVRLEALSMGAAQNAANS